MGVPRTRRASGRALRPLVWLAALAELGGAHVAPPPYPVPDGAEVWSVVYREDGDSSLVRGHAGRLAIAWGSFTDSINQTGWSVLDVHTSPEADGREQGYAAGFLEGALTGVRMQQQLANMWQVDFPGHEVGSMPDAVRIFVAENLDWMWQQTELHGHDPYWHLTGSLLSQLRGLTDGYNHAAARSGGELRPHFEAEILMLSLIDADMDDLVTAIALNGSFVNVHGGRHHGGRDHASPDVPPEAWVADALLARRPGRRGHCSALVQPAPGWSDLWVAHATWDEYRAMLKIVKYFDMPLPTSSVRHMVFTSNPGCLYSADDFYNTDAGLTVIETTITNYNASSWSLVVPQSIMTWGRAMVATRLSTSGEEWTEHFQRYSSGTCNNQWIIVDYKRFRPGERPKSGDGLLWIAEAFPGYTRRADMTSVLLSQGSWPSYNIPYFEDVRRVGGYFAMQERHPLHADDYSFERDSRARMFARAREAGDITSLDSFAHLMRYNGDHDRLENGDRCNAISARCDLNPVGHGYDCFGAIDTKVSRWRRDVQDLSFMGVLSPAHHGAGSRSPPFAWSAQASGVDGCRPSQHVGHPDVFNFSWYSFPGRWAPRRRRGQPRARGAGLRKRWSFAALPGGGAARAGSAAGCLALAALAAGAARALWSGAAWGARAPPGSGRQDGWPYALLAA